MTRPVDRAAVRDAVEADLPRVVELLQQMSLDSPREDTSSPIKEAYVEAFRRIEADPSLRLLVIEVDGRVLGTASFILVPNLSYRGRPHAIVENVVVDEAERGRGLGEQLVRYCLEEARRAGCTRLSLASNRQRTRAHAFYERLGFKQSRLGFKQSHLGFRFDLA
jgi:GNAT superfamily N-acetyltransferase